MARVCFAWWAVPVVGMAVSSAAPGAVLVTYDFGPDNANKTLAAASVAANLTATSISSPSTSAGNTARAHTPWWDGRGTSEPTWGNHLAAGMWDSHGYANNAYFEFTLTPAAGMPLNLESFTFDVGLGDGAYNTHFMAHTSVDGMSSGQALLDKRVTTGPDASGNYDFQFETIDLSAAKYQNLSGVTLRVYYDALDWSTGLIFDNLTVNGTVGVVPEPAGLGLLAVGALVLARRRR